MWDIFNLHHFQLFTLLLTQPILLQVICRKCFPGQLLVYPLYQDCLANGPRTHNKAVDKTSTGYSIALLHSQTKDQGTAQFDSMYMESYVWENVHSQLLQLYTFAPYNQGQVTKTGIDRGANGKT